jgi:small GTP-binding protein
MINFSNIMGSIKSVLQGHLPLVGVYGVTSVGKSTFLNALLKNNEFKVGIGETTKKIHVIKDIDNQKKIDFDNISLDVEYIFKEVPLLKKFSLVDVPGTNKSFLDKDINIIVKKLNVIIWIFDIHGDISQRDLEFLQNVIIKNSVKTVVILNKIDSGMEDIDFEDEEEKNEFISDIKDRTNKIYSFFKSQNAEELLVTIIPLSAKKLLSNVKKTNNNRFNTKHKNIEDILISISNSAFIHKKIFKTDYDQIHNNLNREIDSQANNILKNKRKQIKNKLYKISDNDINSNNINEEKILGTGVNKINIDSKYFKELEKIHKEIKEIK